jgi:hypothetical protein
VKSLELAAPAPSAEVPSWSPRRLKVPARDGRLLCEPPLAEAPRLAAANAARWNRADVDLQGRPLVRLRQWARRECLRAAREYTARLIDRDPLDDFDADDIDALLPRPLYVAGHQPALGHAGVWVKNFAIARLAAATHGVGLNLVVDNDTFATTAIRVPSGDRVSLSVTRIPFDAPRPVQPWEDAEIIDRDLFESFVDRVRATIADSDRPMLLDEMWRDAVAHQAVSSRLVDCLTAARHRQERRWGLANLELPISRLCVTEPFLWFASHVLAHLPRFSECHNAVLHAYRRVNHVRSRNHPVPALDEHDGWGEAPFWVWRKGDVVRRPVFARQQNRTLTLSDGTREFARLPLAPEMEACCAVEELKKLPAQGIRFRTRALTTTLFARICLGDIFVHGIGGAKYDEMTDQIIRRFFGVEPPSFLTMSATLHLPIAEPYDVTEGDERRLQQQLRDVTFNADRHDLGSAAEPLITEKQALIAEQKAAQTEGLSRRQRRQRTPANQDRYNRIKAVNGQLASLATAQRAALTDALQEVRRQLAVNRILQDREFAYCLSPPDRLREFFETALRVE